MKITMTCIFPSRQSAHTAANLVKESGYEIEKVSVSGNRSTQMRGDINASNGFYEKAYLPLTQSSPDNFSPEIGMLYPQGQIASVGAALGFEGFLNPFEREIPDEFSRQIGTNAYMVCTVASHQVTDIENILSKNGGENIKTYIPS